MEIYEIKGLDCSKVKDRMLLLKEIKKVIKKEQKPSGEELQKICKSLNKKYKYDIKKFKQKDGKLFTSVEISPGSYSSFCCLSYYEMLCKYILLVKAYRDASKLKAK